MQVNQSSSSPSDGLATGLTGLTSASDMFLKLLTTQLKAQDPISPMDPNEFVNQLVQFNTLGQIMGIREVLEGFSEATTARSTDAGGK